MEATLTKISYAAEFYVKRWFAPAVDEKGKKKTIPVTLRQLYLYAENSKAFRKGRVSIRTTVVSSDLPSVGSCRVSAVARN